MSALPPEDLLYLRHILDSIDQINTYVAGIDSKEFSQNRLLQDAVARNLEIIGEAAKRLSPEARKATPTIPWKRITGMRDKLIHHYMGIDVQAVWDTVQESVPELRSAVTTLLK